MLVFLVKVIKWLEWREVLYYLRLLMCYFHNYAVEYEQCDVMLPVWGLRFLIGIVMLWSAFLFSCLLKLVLCDAHFVDGVVIAKCYLIKNVNDCCLEYHQEKEGCVEINWAVYFWNCSSLISELTWCIQIDAWYLNIFIEVLYLIKPMNLLHNILLLILNPILI